jgi:IS605 OrfB family transposase
LNIAYWNFDSLEGQKKLSEFNLRSLVQHYRYVEEQSPSGIVWKNMIYDENYNEWPMFPGEKILHNRVARGAVSNFVQNANSALSNKAAGNIKHFQLRYRSKKRDENYISIFEDRGFPKEFLKLPSTYCFTQRVNGRNKRTSVSFKEIFESDENQSGFTLEYDCLTKKHYILYTVPHDWFPPNDRRRRDNQASTPSDEVRIISCDPGVRTFLTCYSPDNHILSVGAKANEHLLQILQETDDCWSKIAKNPEEKARLRSRLQRLYRRLQNLRRDLHWKTAKVLSSNYNLILMPHFNTAQMLRGKKLAKVTKRQLQAFSFFQFKQRLTYACRKRQASLIFVSEDYTSKTCGGCGNLKHDLQGSKTYNCSACGKVLDRDENASRNILLKNLGYASPNSTLFEF